METGNFLNIHRQGFIRVGAAVPLVALTDPVANMQRLEALVRKAAAESINLLVFPELSLSGYSNDDLFFQDTLLTRVKQSLVDLARNTADLHTCFIVGVPLEISGAIYNTAVVIKGGVFLGCTPKTYLPNYREYYEKRYFASGTECATSQIEIGTQQVPFGHDLIFQASDFKKFTFHTEICEDLWSPTPPSSYGAMAGAHILTNLSASNITIGKSANRHALCRVQSRRCIAAYIYTAAGGGESTTDLAWDGQAMIYENGELLEETERFCDEPQIIYQDIDVDRIYLARLQNSTFRDASNLERCKFRVVDFTCACDMQNNLGFQRTISRYPYIPDDTTQLSQHCYEAHNIQVAGLVQRLRVSGCKNLVIGVSGGLDSTQALLVACKAMDRLNLPRTNIYACTLPAFATSQATKKNALALMESLGVTASETDMSPICMQMLQDIAHPFAKGEKVYDVTFENVQAGARTSYLFRLANQCGGMVVGTGDLSELALGWCTYGVGDHMAHYNVNAAVPKTLIQHLIRWVAMSDEFGATTGEIVTDILCTDISPELIPGNDRAANDTPAQLTEDVIGPYALHDFFLYHTVACGLRPSKIAFLAWHAWRADPLSMTLPRAAEKTYDFVEIRKWLHVFLWRFFQTSQFKRSALPNGPIVSSGGSLSPRGEWRAPSDGCAVAWIEELENNTPENI